MTPLLSAPKKREKRRGCPSSSFLKFSGTAKKTCKNMEKWASSIGGSLVRNAQPLRKLLRGLRGPEVPAVLPPLAAAAGPAQASPRPPAHVGPQPRLLPVRSSVLAVGHVHPGQALHERPGLQPPGGRVLYDPHQGVKVRNDLKGAEHQRVALQSRRVVSARLCLQTGLAQTMSKCPGNVV